MEKSYFDNLQKTLGFAPHFSKLISKQVADCGVLQYIDGDE